MLNSVVSNRISCAGSYTQIALNVGPPMAHQWPIAGELLVPQHCVLAAGYLVESIGFLIIIAIFACKKMI